MWPHEEIIDAIADGLADRESELAREQAVHGLDAIDEVDLHPLLAEGVARGGFGVLREQPYPHEWTRKGEATLPEHRDRQRCDLVLTPGCGQRLADDWATTREADRIRASGEGTLFTHHAECDADAHAPPSDAVMPEEAFWLEVKVVGQFTYRNGFTGPNPSYASEMIKGTTTDLRKLASDEMIASGALLLIVFTADRETAEHDLVALLHKCLDKSLPVSGHTVRHVAIADRIGNAWCSPALIPVRRSILA